MVRYENECVDCGLPCIESCPYKKVPHYYCDRCGDEIYPDDVHHGTIAGHEYEDLCEECFEMTEEYEIMMEEEEE